MLKSLKYFFAGAAGVVMAACTTTPVPMTSDCMSRRNTEVLGGLFGNSSAEYDEICGIVTAAQIMVANEGDIGTRATGMAIVATMNERANNIVNNAGMQLANPGEMQCEVVRSPGEETRLKNCIMVFAPGQKPSEAQPKP